MKTVHLTISLLALLGMINTAAGQSPVAAEMVLAATDFLDSLDDEQRRDATITGKPPRDILTKAERKLKALADKGAKFPDLSSAQQANLMELIREYVACHLPTFRRVAREAIKSS